MDQIEPNRSNIVAFVLGILIFAIGILLLINRAGVLNLNFERIVSFLVVVAGGFEAITSFATSNRGRLMLGSLLFLTGLLVLLVSFDFVPDSWAEIWASALIIPGLSFLMLFFSDVKEHRLLIISIVLIAVGCLGMYDAKSKLNIADYMIGSLHLLIPLAIVLTGFYLVWKEMFRSRRKGAGKKESADQR